MDNHTFLGKRLLATTDLSDFTDYQGIGRDPLYRRYAAVQSVVNREIPAQFRSFLAIPDYVGAEDNINWYIDEWKEQPERLTDLSGERRSRYDKIKDETIASYRQSINKLSGEDLQIMACVTRYIDDDFIFCCDGKVFVIAWGMTPDPDRHISKGLLIHGAPEITKFKVIFESGEHGSFKSGKRVSITVKKGESLTASSLPEVQCDEGYEFEGWQPDPVGMAIESDLTCTAQYNVNIPALPPVPPELPPEIPEEYICNFDAGQNGVLQGNGVLHKTPGSMIMPMEVPPVKAAKGFNFTGWTPDPLNTVVNDNITFYALYEQRLPWYKRFWAWLMGLGWVKWLLLALLIAMLTFLVLWLTRGCDRFGIHREINGVGLPNIEIVDGDTIADFGKVAPIKLHDGRLPDDYSFIAAPIRNEDGTIPEIVREPGVPPYIPTRLILFLEDENGDIDRLASDFKNAYPGDGYSIIGFDKYVKSLVIQIPENQRDQIRETIQQKLPAQPFLVFDEEIYEINDTNYTPLQTSKAGWHLDAVKAPQAWQITKGSPEVTVAVVDDGIDPSHPMFAGRIKDAYNVFTQNNCLSPGEGHGTHTAGLAVGSLDLLNQGAAGIAPDCMLMPVQVLDHEMCPLSALISGIMYAVHQDADVVNVSIGPSFQGLNALPVEMQQEIGLTKFKNAEKLWTRVSQIAARKKSIVVFAAGNDDIFSIIPPENRSQFAITVGAVDQKLDPTQFTNYGPCTDLSAPGTDIYSSFPGGGVKSFDGTSMSAPIVSGAIALMKTLKRDLTVEEARNVLYKTGLPVHGYLPPMIQVADALDAVKRGDFSVPAPVPMQPVPAGTVPVDGGTPPASWTVVQPGVGAVEELPWVTIVPGTGVIGVSPGVGTGVIPGNGNVVVDPETGAVVPGTNTGVIPPGSTTQPGTGNTQPATPANPAQGNVDDYAEIRKMIEMYKQKIKELERQLPENN